METHTYVCPHCGEATEGTEREARDRRLCGECRKHLVPSGPGFVVKGRPKG
jgi:predicted SprT family Zn-dependent metalloprotease